MGISLHKNAAGEPNRCEYWRDYWAWAARSPGGVRNPGGALDEMPRRLGRDQEGEPPGSRRGLSREYLNATSKFLAEAGLDPNEIDSVVEILAARVTDNGQEGGGTSDQRRGLMPHLAGAADAARRLAFDAYGNRRQRPRPMSTRQRERFEQRFPGASRIKVIP